MKKKIVGAIIIASLLITGLNYMPLADVLTEEDILLDSIGDDASSAETNSGESNQSLKPLTIDDINRKEKIATDEEEDFFDENELLNTGAGDLMYVDEDILEIEEYVPDEPENVVESDEDDYYEPEIQYYDDKPFDASYITGEGTDRIKKVIIAYAESLGGTFRSPYYKGGKAVSIQCCAYVNQVWKHVFGKDIYDPGIMTTNSHEGETIYNFLSRTEARAGDILYVRYWKASKNKWSSHFMILLGYDENGVYVTDGYETDDGVFLVWRIDKKAIYSQSNFFKTSGSDKDKKGSMHYSGKDGSFFKLYRMSQEEWCDVANADYDLYASDPSVQSCMIKTNRSEGKYTIDALIHATNGLERVQFPVWTVAGGQDDLNPNYETDEAASGSIEDMGDELYRVKYTVDIKDHNCETGNYMGEIYMVDNEGVVLTYECSIVNMDGAVGGTCVDYIPWMIE